MADISWRVLADGLAFPEGPSFAPDGTLWWVEIDRGCLGWLKDGVAGRVAVGGRPNGSAIDADGRIWFCDQGLNAIRRHDPADGRTRTVVDALDGAPLGKPNDLAFDPHGNLVFTCPNDARSEPAGYVCGLSPAGDLHRIADRLFFPNGLAFTPDGQTLVIAETYRQRLWTGAWDHVRRTWNAPRVLADLPGPVGPDGMAFDAGGTLWVALYGQGRIVALDPTGRTIAEHAVPGPNPTNLALDPAGVLGLVATEAARGELLSAAELAAAPALFAPARERATSNNQIEREEIT